MKFDEWTKENNIDAIHAELGRVVDRKVLDRVMKQCWQASRADALAEVEQAVLDLNVPQFGDQSFTNGFMSAHKQILGAVGFLKQAQQ